MKQTILLCFFLFFFFLTKKTLSHLPLTDVATVAAFEIWTNQCFRVINPFFSVSHFSKLETHSVNCWHSSVGEVAYYLNFMGSSPSSYGSEELHGRKCPPPVFQVAV